MRKVVRAAMQPGEHADAICRLKTLRDVVFLSKARAIKVAMKLANRTDEEVNYWKCPRCKLWYIGRPR